MQTELRTSRIVISRTPLRISFFGGGTDYPDYYLRERGAVLGTTIDKYTYVSVNTMGPFFEHKIRVGYSRAELVDQVEEILHPSVRECLKFKGIEEGLDIHIFSDLPARSGLGSSSSFTVGFLRALYALCDKKIAKETLAKEALYVEQELIGEMVGSQDQCHAAYGGVNCFYFSKEGIEVERLMLVPGVKEQIEEESMLFFTGLTRFADDILTEQIEKTKTKQIDENLDQMFQLVEEGKKTLLSRSFDVGRDFGALLHEGWEMKKKCSSQITNSKIDEAYEAARRAGAYGGKLCGAGKGGFLLLLVPKERQERVKQALHPLLHVPFRLEESGSSIIYTKD